MDDSTPTPYRPMISPDEFDALAADLAKLNGLDLETASALLGQIGDTPELAEDGRVVITWKGTEYQLTWPNEDLSN